MLPVDYGKAPQDMRLAFGISRDVRYHGAGTFSLRSEVFHALLRGLRVPCIECVCVTSLLLPLNDRCFRHGNEPMAYQP